MLKKTDEVEERSYKLQVCKTSTRRGSARICYTAAPDAVLPAVEALEYVMNSRN